MRFALAVLVAALAQLAFFVKFAASGDSGAGYFGFLYILFAAIGAGWFAERRGLLAGALCVVVAAILDGIYVLSGPAGTGMAPIDTTLSIARFVIAFWPYIAIGAVAGAVGESLRRRVLRPR